MTNVMVSYVTMAVALMIDNDAMEGMIVLMVKMKNNHFVTMEVLWLFKFSIFNFQKTKIQIQNYDQKMIDAAIG